METLSLEKQVLGLMEAGKSVPAGYGLDSYAQSLGLVRTRCLEYQGQEGGGSTHNSRFTSWRGSGHGSGHSAASSGAGSAAGQHERFGKYANHNTKNTTSISTPIVHTSSTPVSNVKGSWSNAAKKQVVAAVSQETSVSASVSAQAQAPASNVYKVPSSQRGAGFNKSKEEVESKILNNMILGKLNKFTEENYDSIKNFLEQILSNDETDFLKDFMILVFKKATHEKIYCPLYVKLIAELAAQYPIIKTELMILYDTYIKEFEKIEEDKDEDYDEFCASQREKIYRLGYGQFLAQLTRQGVLDADALIRMYTTLLNLVSTYTIPGMNHRNQVEQMCACMSSMTQAFQKEKNPALVAIRNAVAAQCKGPMDSIIKKARAGELPGLSARGRCALMDCMDIFCE